jgi:hypothetical protein
MKPSKVESVDIRQLRKVLEGINSNLRNTVAQCIAAGKLLTTIKAKTKYGDWSGVLESVELTNKTADRYMFLWEHRSELDLSKVRTIMEAFALICLPSSEQTPTLGRLPKPTTQNEPLTHEKTRISGRQNADGQLAVRFPPPGPECEPAKQPEIVLDKTGYPIPPELLPEWKRATDQAMGWIRAFDEIHRQVLAVHGKDFTVARINKSSLESLHSNYRESLMQAVPYAVCGLCQGRTPDHCKACNPCQQEDGKPVLGVGLGWVNKHFWETATPIEYRQIRQRAYGTNPSAGLSA